MALKVSFGAAAMLLSLSMLGLGLCPARVRAQGYPYFMGQIITVAFPWCPQGGLMMFDVVYNDPGLVVLIQKKISVV